MASSRLVARSRDIANVMQRLQEILSFTIIIYQDDNILQRIHLQRCPLGNAETFCGFSEENQESVVPVSITSYSSYEAVVPVMLCWELRAVLQPGDSYSIHSQVNLMCLVNSEDKKYLPMEVTKLMLPSK
ncbi:hypothetical protein DUI87_10457 [Hirundo rustica rustica]|uniref:Uncharacterized protein n=1 Tax=Hirundo rustica rustica TaxID=333673 RepID=A0A3M0KPH8_HIRRU|nr:hypothetical protein DUI87_10457 [Hirundo rustica rustica]